MTKMTYTKKKETPMPAQRGWCDGCGARCAIVMVAKYGNFCRACADAIEIVWNKHQTVRTVVGDDFKLRDD